MPATATKNVYAVLIYPPHGKPRVTELPAMPRGFKHPLQTFKTRAKAEAALEKFLTDNPECSSMRNIAHTPGQDRYGHFILYNAGTAKEFRSAMPDAETAKCAAAAPDLLNLLTRWNDQADGIMSKGCHLGALIEDTRTAIARATA